MSRQNGPLASPDAGGEIVDMAPPRSRVPPIRLATLRDLRDELGRVYRQARAGQIPPAHATRYAYILAQLRDMILAIDLEARLTALEEKRDSKFS